MKHSNPQKFWKHFRTLKRPSNKRAFNINNKTKSNDISTEFAHHFNYLLNTPRTDSVYPEQESNVNMHEPEHFLISPNEIKTTVTLLKLNKCCDPSNIFAEHIVYSNNEPLYSWLSDCFNQIFESGYVPKALSISTIIPLVKSYNKSLSDPNNYRGISLIPIVTKLLELLIIAKCPEITTHNKNQFGFKTKSSTVHAAYIVKETVNFYNMRNTPVFICSLDAEKAFDSCNWDVLFSKLSAKRRLPLPVISTLKNLYLSGSATVIYDNVYSYKFNLSQGVRQGSIL